MNTGMEQETVRRARRARARRPDRRDRPRPRRRRLGRGAAGLEPLGRPAARRRRLPRDARATWPRSSVSPVANGLPRRVAGHRPQRGPDRCARRRAARARRPDARRRDRRRAPGPRRAGTAGTTSSAAAPSTASPRSPAPRPTWASSATCSAAAVSWMVRKHGLGHEQRHGARGGHRRRRLVRVDAENEPDLFWALRGGGGNFGAVIALEFELYAVARSTPAAILLARSSARPRS